MTLFLNNDDVTKVLTMADTIAVLEQAQSAGIRANNGILTEAAEARGIRVVDIYDISLRAATERDLVAGDGLHPSGAQYALWVDRIAPAVRELLPSA